MKEEEFVRYLVGSPPYAPGSIHNPLQGEKELPLGLMPRGSRGRRLGVNPSCQCRYLHEPDLEVQERQIYEYFEAPLELDLEEDARWRVEQEPYGAPIGVWLALIASPAMVHDYHGQEEIFLRKVHEVRCHKGPPEHGWFLDFWSRWAGRRKKKRP